MRPQCIYPNCEETAEISNYICYIHEYIIAKCKQINCFNPVSYCNKGSDCDFHKYIKTICTSHLAQKHVMLN